MIPMAAPTSRFILCPVGDQVPSKFQEWSLFAILSQCPLFGGGWGWGEEAGEGGPKCIGYSFIHLSTEQAFVETTHIHAVHQGLFCSGEQDGSGLEFAELPWWYLKAVTEHRKRELTFGANPLQAGTRYAFIGSSVINNCPVLQVRGKNGA